MPYEFFLGGRDLEMAEIKAVLEEYGQTIHDAGLGWGAHASAYAAEIAACAAVGHVPVLVELNNGSHPATNWAPAKEAVTLPEGAIIVDHHGDEFAGQPQSILQVINLLGLEPSRRQVLIALNDEGYIPAMLEAGATQNEAMAIRQADWEAQGVPGKVITANVAAAKSAEITEGGMYVIRVEVSKTAPVADTLFFIQGPNQNQLILGQDGECNYYGTPNTVRKLEKKFGGWTGGLSTEANAFWGCGDAPPAEVEQFLRDLF